MNQGALSPYDAQAFTAIADTVRKDALFQASALELRRSMRALTAEAVNSTGITPSVALAKDMLASAKRQAAFDTKPPAGCQVSRVVTNVTTAVQGWVTTVVTAGQHLANCFQACDQKFPRDPLGWGLCHGGCLVTAFEAITLKTWGVVDTVTEEVVTEVVHCNPLQGLFPTPHGTINLPAGLAQVAAPGETPAVISPGTVTLIQSILKGLDKFAQCLLNGKWTITNLGNLKITIPGLSQVPVAISVCVDAACATTIRDYLGFGGLRSLLVSIVNVISDPAALAQVITGSSVLTTIFAALATALGTSVGVAAQYVLAVIAVVLIQGEVVAGEILLLQTLGLAPNGVCITHPSVPIVALGVLNPAVGLMALAETPLIVTPK
jgi:hypothetical protein